MSVLLGMILTMIGLCLSAHAKVDLASTQPMVIPVDKYSPKITSKDVAEIIPLDMQPTDNSGAVAGRIADRGLQFWYNNSGVKETSIGQVAQEAEQKLKTDITLNSGDKAETAHHLCFSVEAFQTLAKLRYTGWLNAEVDYKARDAQTEFSVKDRLWSNKDLILSHTLGANEESSRMGLGWSF